MDTEFNLMGGEGTGDSTAEITNTNTTEQSVEEIETQTITNPHEWAKGLEEGLTKASSLHKFKDIGSLAKAYIDLEKNMGKSPFPHAKSTEEERIAFYRKAGVPDVDKYDLDGAKFGMSEDISKELKALASKSGIHPSALANVLGFVQEKTNSNNSAITEQMNAEREMQIESIKKEYGSAFNKYLNLGVEVAKSVFSPEELGSIQKRGLNNDPIFVKLLMDRAKGMFGEEMISDDNTSRNIVATPDAIEKRIQEILTDRDYTDTTSARNGSLVKEMEKLFLAKSKMS